MIEDGCMWFGLASYIYNMRSVDFYVTLSHSKMVLLRTCEGRPLQGGHRDIDGINNKNKLTKEKRALASIDIPASPVRASLHKRLCKNHPSVPHSAPSL